MVLDIDMIIFNSEYRQELIITDESAYETDREACYEKDRRRRRALRK